MKILCVNAGSSSLKFALYEMPECKKIANGTFEKIGLEGSFYSISKEEGDVVKQGSELGFIKFGSRVDLFIPIDSQVHAELEDKVKGGISILASI